MLLANADLAEAAMCAARSLGGAEASIYSASYRRSERRLVSLLRSPDDRLRIIFRPASSIVTLQQGTVYGTRGAWNTYLNINYMSPWYRTLGVVHGISVDMGWDQVAASKALAAYLLLAMYSSERLIRRPIHPNSSGRCLTAIRAMNIFWWMLDQRFRAPAGECGAAGGGGLNATCLYNSDYLHFRPPNCRPRSPCPIDANVVGCQESHWNARLSPRVSPGDYIKKVQKRFGITPADGCCWPPAIKEHDDGLEDAFRTAWIEYLYEVTNCDRRP